MTEETRKNLFEYFGKDADIGINDQTSHFSANYCKTKA